MNPSVATRGAPVPRPIVSELERGPHGRRFTIRFEPGQYLAPHRNPAEVVITALAGCGDVTVAGAGAREVTPGVMLRIEPTVEHGVVAGSAGLILAVELIARDVDAH